MNGPDICTISVGIRCIDRCGDTDIGNTLRSYTCNAIGVYESASTLTDGHSKGTAADGHRIPTERRQRVRTLVWVAHRSFQAHKFLITVELLLGDIPDKATFNNPQLKRSLDPYYQLTLGMSKRNQPDAMDETHRSSRSRR